VEEEEEEEEKRRTKYMDTVCKSKCRPPPE